MSRLAPDDIKKFRNICQWVYDTWFIHRALFDDNADADLLQRSRHRFFLARLSFITQEYSILQLAKLHDPALQKNTINLGLEYIRKHGGWDPERARTLKRLHKELKWFLRIPAHNDQPTAVDDVLLGEFPKNADLEYFSTLEKFISVIQSGVRFEFERSAVVDAARINEVLVKDSKGNIDFRRPSSPRE